MGLVPNHRLKRVAGFDNGVPSLRFSEIPTPRPGGIKPDQPGISEEMKSLGPNNKEEENDDTLCFALVETNLAYDKPDAQLRMNFFISTSTNY